MYIIGEDRKNKCFYTKFLFSNYKTSFFKSYLFYERKHKKYEKDIYIEHNNKNEGYFCCHSIFSYKGFTCNKVFSFFSLKSFQYIQSCVLKLFELFFLYNFAYLQNLKKIQIKLINFINHELISN